MQCIDSEKQLKNYFDNIIYNCMHGYKFQG